jgi:hypothetical protein
VSRSSRHDLFEKAVLPFFLLRPFRCLKCEERHYNFVYSKRMEVEPSAQRSLRSDLLP